MNKFRIHMLLIIFIACIGYGSTFPMFKKTSIKLFQGSEYSYAYLKLGDQLTRIFTVIKKYPLKLDQIQQELKTLIEEYVKTDDLCKKEQLCQECNALQKIKSEYPQIFQHHLKHALFCIEREMDNAVLSDVESDNLHAVLLRIKSEISLYGWKDENDQDEDDFE